MNPLEILNHVGNDYLLEVILFGSSMLIMYGLGKRHGKKESQLSTEVNTK